MKSKTLLSHLAAFITIILWGTTFIATKVLLSAFSPVEILFFRTLIAVIVLFLCYPKPMKFLGFRDEGLLVLTSCFGLSVYFLFENYGISLSSASNVSVILSAVPLLTALFSHFILKTKIRYLPFLIGFTIAMAGIVFITTGGDFSFQIKPLGDLLAICAGICWAMYCITVQIVRDRHPEVSGIGITKRIFVYGLITTVPSMLVTGFSFDFSRFAVPQNLLWMLFLGLGASALGFLLWNTAVKHLGSVQTNVYLYVQPFVTFIASYIVLHEKVTVWSVCGAVLILIGLLISQEHKTEKAVTK